MKHAKHTTLASPSLGEYHRNEWAFIGAPCSQIQDLVNTLTKTLGMRWTIGYADADHKSADEQEQAGTCIDSGGTLLYTDKITHHRLDARLPLNKYSLRPWYNDVDALFINGNHFPGKHQVVIIDPKKKASLQKKLDRLTDVQLILLADGITEVYPFVRDKLGSSTPPVYSIHDTDQIARFFANELTAKRPPLNGLALVGGKSRRMGTDKGLLTYHEKPQRETLYHLLSGFCSETWFSCRPDQATELSEIGGSLPDTFTGLGPMGAILSAFREKPDAAWLVVAVDLPLLDAETLALLIENRDPSKMATAFNSPVNAFPEPLVAIWEPRAYPILLQFLAQGYSCPRKALINSEVKLLDAPNPDALLNINTPEERDAVSGKLK